MLYITVFATAGVLVLRYIPVFTYSAALRYLYCAQVCPSVCVCAHRPQGYVARAFEYVRVCNRDRNYGEK